MSPMPSPPPMKRDPVRIEVCRDAEDLMRHAAQCFVGLAAGAFGARGRFDVAMSACAAPRRLCEAIAQENFTFQIVWPGVHLFLTDEWCVPPGDDRDNLGRVRAALGETPIPEENIHRLRVEEDPDAAAARAEKDLRGHASGAHRFDLVVLGLGDDGHVAGLPPGGVLLDEKDRLVGVVRGGSGPARLTLTPAAIASARTVMVLASGNRKADAVRAALGADAQDARLPVHSVHPRDGQILWLIDEAAASHMADPGADPGADQPT